MECNEGCVVCSGVYKCYNIVEQRKIKLEKIANTDE
jgi:hypothetical protein